MIDHNMDPQAALDASRFCISDGTSNGAVSFEYGIEESVISKLKSMGHHVVEKPVVGVEERQLFGNGQIITRDEKSGKFCGGSDMRVDGIAIGWD